MAHIPGCDCRRRHCFPALRSAASPALSSHLRSASVDRAPELAGGGAVAAERTQDIALSFKAALHQSVRDQPRATLAGAAILGFVLGALWKLSR